MATISYEGFADHCTKYSALWSSVKYGILVCFGSKGNQLLGLHATFGNQPIRKPSINTLSNIPGQPTAISGVMTLDEFVAIVRQMDKGELRIKDKTFECKSFSDPDHIILRATRDEYLRSADLVKDWVRPWPALFLRRYGPDTSSLGISELTVSRALQSGEYTEESLYLFAFNKLGFGVGGSQSTQIEILAPLYISLFAELAVAKLDIKVDVDISIPTDTFFIKVWQGAQRDGSSIIVKFGDAKIIRTYEAEGRTLRTLMQSVELPSPVEQAGVVLIHDGEKVDYCSYVVKAKPVKTVKVLSIGGTVDMGGTLTIRKLQKVFVVHGRNESLRSSIFEFIISIGLKPMAFSEAIQLTGKSSPYIGEILECAFDVAQAIVVLLTGDDKVMLHRKYWKPDDPSYETKFNNQARPNVLFEAGMAFGVQPDRTVLVQIGYVKPISDLQGRHVLKLDNSEEKRREFAKRLKTAGCEVDTSGNEWQNTGDFHLSD